MTSLTTGRAPVPATPIAPDAPDAPSRPASIVPSGVVYALQFTSVAVWVAYATVFFKSLGIDLALIGLLAAVPSAVAIVAAPAWGLVADRMGDMRPAYLVAAVGAAGAAAILALAPPMPWLALAVVAVAVGTSGLTPLLDARTVQRLWPHRERFGEARVWGSISFMVATISVGVLLETIGVRGMFAVYSVALVAAGVASYLLLGKPGRGLRVAGVGPLAALGLLRDPGLGLFFVGSAVVWTSSTIALALFSLRVVELGGDTSLIGVGWAVNAGLEIPVMLLFPRIARRVRIERLIVAGIAVQALRSALWSVAGTPLAFVAAASVSGISFGLVLVGTTTYIASRVPSSLQATAQALFSSTTFAIGAILGAVIAGQIAQTGGLAAVYPASAIGSAIGAVLVWIAIARGTHVRRA